jgi:hypothetical protein
MADRLTQGVLRLADARSPFALVKAVAAHVQKLKQNCHGGKNSHRVYRHQRRIIWYVA